MKADLYSSTPDHGQGGPPGSNVTFTPRLYGPFSLDRGGRSLSGDPSFARAPVRKLLKWFLLHPGERMNGAFLCELLWPDRYSGVGLNRLHASLHYLRRLLEPDLGSRQASAFIHTDRSGRYHFDYADRWWVDHLDTEPLRVAARAAERAGDVNSAVSCYEALLELYRRAFLPEDVFDPAFDEARHAFDVAFRETENRLLHLYLRGDRAYDAFMLALAMIERDPFSEDAFSAIAEVNLRQGNFVAARTQLASYAELLHRELRLKPGPAVQRLWGRATDQGTSPDGGAEGPALSA